MERIQKDKIIRDLRKKMVFLVGPRQTGKTTLAKSIGADFHHTVYLNWDHLPDRAIIKKQSWLPNADLLILDELHKMPKWKNYLKGLYDTKPIHLSILVTGSARLDVFKKAGDSLAGRYFAHHLLPLSPSELHQSHQHVDLERLIKRSGFPEPYFADTDIEADRWRMQYINSLITVDVLDFEKIQDLSAIRTIFELLRLRVGSPISYDSIARDVGISANTVKKYIRVLESLYIVFRITPYSKKISRSITKQPKIYFFDAALVKGDNGVLFENFAALNLLKHIYSKRDYEGKNITLHYLRDKEKRETDFAIVNDGVIEKIIEAKWAENALDSNLLYFSKTYQLSAMQIVYHLKRSYLVDQIPIMLAKEFFVSLDA